MTTHLSRAAGAAAKRANDDSAAFGWRSVEALAERLNAGASAPTFTPHALRHYVRNADQNGLAPHVRRLGRKVLIHEPGFLAWLGGDQERAA